MFASEELKRIFPKSWWEKVKKRRPEDVASRYGDDRKT